jgi:hypothetical protein
LLTLTAAAQSAFSNQTNAALKKVIEDYPNHFSNIKGDRITATDPDVNYKSKVTIPGSVSCVLTQHNNQEAYSWNCELFTTKDFDKAKTRYSDLYHHIHNTIIKLQGERPVILNGQYTAPDKSKKQNSIPFHFLPNANIIKRLHVELQLQNDDGNWKINLNVFEQEDAALKSEA